MESIAFVRNSRKEIKEDNWGEITSTITLVDEINEEAFEGVDLFSHLEIVFYFDKVSDEKAIATARFPRNNQNWDFVGTFAQRNKNRPNKIGLTTVKVLKRDGKSIEVKGLDAIDGTPILDIKPIYKQFLPKEEIKQPKWVDELMEKYW